MQLHSFQQNIPKTFKQSFRRTQTSSYKPSQVVSNRSKFKGISLSRKHAININTIYHNNDTKAYCIQSKALSQGSLPKTEKIRQSRMLKLDQQLQVEPKNLEINSAGRKGIRRVQKKTGKETQMLLNKNPSGLQNFLQYYQGAETNVEQHLNKSKHTDSQQQGDLLHTQGNEYFGQVKQPKDKDHS